MPPKQAKYLKFNVPPRQYERLEREARALGLGVHAYCERLMGLADADAAGQVGEAPKGAPKASPPRERGAAPKEKPSDGDAKVARRGAAEAAKD
jgi:hypothetical protein